VWVNGSLAGEWRVPARGEMAFQYDAAWVGSEEGRPLSLSLSIK
jgi:serine/threonine-protein kinase HipA